MAHDGEDGKIQEDAQNLVPLLVFFVKIQVFKSRENSENPAFQ